MAMNMNSVASHYIRYIRDLPKEEFKNRLIKLVRPFTTVKQDECIYAYFEENYDQLTQKIVAFFQKDYRQEEQFIPIDYELYLVMLVPLQISYQERNLPLEIYEASLSDLNWRLTAYLESQGRAGLTAEDKMWLARIYHLKIFKLGSLQFEMIQSQEEKINPENWGLQDKHLDDLLSVHIMYGEDISRPASINSFIRALDFFDEHFPRFNYHYFYCKSWLLYPGNREFLDEKSKIISFMKLFNIVYQEQDVKIPYKYIFYKEPDQVKKSDVSTSLQRFAYDHPEALGIGTGLIEKERVKKYGEKE